MNKYQKQAFKSTTEEPKGLCEVMFPYGRWEGDPPVYSYHLHREHPAAVLFEARADELVSIILNNLQDRNNFVSVDCLLRGPAEEVAIPKITVTLKEEVPTSLKLTLEALSINVEFEYLIRHIDRRTTYDNALLHDKNQLHMGASIGRVGIEYSTGTLGGFIVLTDGDGNQNTYGLTNHHVAMPTKKAEASQPSLQGQIQRKVPGYNYEVDMPKLFMETPSKEDRSRSLKDKERQLEDAIAGLEKCKSRVDETTGSGKGRLERHLEIVKTTEDQLRNEQERFKQDNAFGFVYRTSGFRTKHLGLLDPVTKKSTLSSVDWAIVALHPNDQTHQNVCSIPPHKPFVVTDVSPITDLILLDHTLYKHGRTTSVTCGLVNGVKARCNIQDNTEITAEFTMIPRQGYLRDVFSDGGDSGSFVTDDGGEWHALVFGGNEKEGVFYMTAAKSIVDDIEEVTGMKFSLPQLDLSQV